MAETTVKIFPSLWCPCPKSLGYAYMAILQNVKS